VSYRIVLVLAVFSFSILFYSPTISFEESKQCNYFHHVNIVKYNGESYCVKPTSYYTLHDRGWASMDHFDPTAMSLNVVEYFIMWNARAPFNSLNLEITEILESYPEQYHISASYSFAPNDYSWDQGSHIMNVVIIDGKIIEAVTDNYFNQLEKKPISPTVDIIGEFVEDEVIVGFVKTVSKTTVKDVIDGCATAIKETVDDRYLVIILRNGQSVSDTISCFYDNELYVYHAEPNYISKWK